MDIEDYVSYDVAKTLKEKGYIMVSDRHYFTEDINIGDIHIPKEVPTSVFKVSREFDNIKVYAPSLYVVQKWLREKHGLIVEPKILHTGKEWFYDVIRIENGTNVIADGFSYKTYEECLQYGIMDALTYI